MAYIIPGVNATVNALVSIGESHIYRLIYLTHRDWLIDGTVRTVASLFISAIFWKVVRKMMAISQKGKQLHSHTHSTVAAAGYCSV